MINIISKSPLEWELKPTMSLSWDNCKILIYAVASFGLLIGLIGLVLGYPLILPFCGIEVLAFAAAFYFVQLKGKIREIIKFEGDMIIVKQYSRGETFSIKANKKWVLVRLQRPTTPLEVLKLYISYSGKTIELGSFLNESEKSQFAGLLKRALL